MPNPFLLVQPIPLSLAEHVTVAWAFDGQDRVIDVFVDKTAEFGE